MIKPNNFLDENQDPDSDADEREQLKCYYEQLQRGDIDALNSCKVKIIDFGNSCYRDSHITDDIQTREYRSPEVIIGSNYDESADIWSAACIVSL